jgi:hypothetical protein
MFEFYDEAKVKNVCTVPFVPNLSSGAIVGARKNIPTAMKLIGAG